MTGGMGVPRIRDIPGVPGVQDPGQLASWMAASGVAGLGGLRGVGGPGGVGGLRSVGGMSVRSGWIP